MGILKLEINIPDFEKELNVNIIIRKDGEVYYNTTSSPSTGFHNGLDKVNEVTSVDRGKKLTSPDELDQKIQKNTTTTKRKISGNLMDLEI